jgi:hypothetical protein
VFTARYALSPYIKQIRFIFKGLMRNMVKDIRTFALCSDPFIKNKTTEHFWFISLFIYTIQQKHTWTHLASFLVLSTEGRILWNSVYLQKLCCNMSLERKTGFQNLFLTSNRRIFYSGCPNGSKNCVWGNVCHFRFPFARSWHNYISLNNIEMMKVIRSVQNTALLTAE